MPQIIRNARTQSAEALSPFFLAEWLMVRRGRQEAGGRERERFFLLYLFSLSSLALPLSNNLLSL